MNTQAPIIVHGHYNSDNVEFTMRAFDVIALAEYYRMVDGGLITLTKLEIPTGYTFESPIRLDKGVTISGYSPDDDEYVRSLFTESEVGYRVSFWCELCAEWHSVTYPEYSTSFALVQSLKKGDYKFTVHSNAINKYRWDDVTVSFN